MIYTLKRPRKTEFGDRPLPGGVVRLFQADSSGRHAARGRGRAGPHARGRGRPARRPAPPSIYRASGSRRSYVTRRDSTKAGGVRTVATADYRVTLANATDSAATVDVQEERGGEWSVLSSWVPAEKLSSTLTRFRAKVPARGEAALTYRVRVVW